MNSINDVVWERIVARRSLDIEYRSWVCVCVFVSSYITLSLNVGGEKHQNL